MSRLPRWEPVGLDGDEWDLHPPKPRKVVYVCKAPGCVVTCGTYQDTRDHTEETGHWNFYVKEVE